MENADKSCPKNKNLKELVLLIWFLCETNFKSETKSIFDTSKHPSEIAHT